MNIGRGFLKQDLGLDKILHSLELSLVFYKVRSKSSFIDYHIVILYMNSLILKLTFGSQQVTGSGVILFSCAKVFLGNLPVTCRHQTDNQS